MVSLERMGGIHVNKRRGTLDTLEGSFGYVIEEARMVGAATALSTGEISKAGAESERGKWIRITDYSGTDTELQIPEEIEGLPVKVLTKKTFLSRKQLRKVILPDTLEEIGDWVFAYCTNQIGRAHV